MTDPNIEFRNKLMVLQPIETKEALHLWLKFYLNVDLADCTVSRFATSNPLEMVWQVYQFCADKTNDEPKIVRFIAGRSSQKTLSDAVLAVILPLHFKRGVVHFGGTVAQANRAYTYFRKFVSRPYIKDYLKDDPTQKKSTFVVDGEEVEVEILSISPMSVQGPHQPVVSIDELASLSPDKMVAYQDVEGVPVYTHDGKPWINVGISSRKGKYTVIEREYEERDKNGIKFEFWTVLENTQRCPDEISGIIPTIMHVSVTENVALSDADFQKLSDNEKAKFETVNAMDKCLKCPLATICAGDLKKQTSTCRTLRPVKSVMQEFKGASSLEWFLSQKMSMTPSGEGMVYSRFKRELFEKTPREIYTIFKGEDPGHDISEDVLIQEMVKAGVRRYAGIDHGHTHPTSIVVVYEDGVGNAFIMKVHEQVQLEPPQVVELVSNLRERYRFTVLYPDTAAPAINKMLSKVVRVHDDFTKKVESGIAGIRSKIAPMTGGTKLYGLEGNCEPLIKNFEKYHYAYDTDGRLTDTPVKEDDDSLDALSYISQNIWISRPQIIIPTDKNESAPGTMEGDIKQQYENWLNIEIRKATSQAGGVDNKVHGSKKGGFNWGI